MAIRKDIFYTVGSVSGYMGLERMCFIGAASEPPNEKEVELCVPQVFIMLADETRQLRSMQADGLLGLSPSKSGYFLQDLYNHSQISSKVFSISLDKQVLTIGGYDMARFAAP